MKRKKLELADIVLAHRKDFEAKYGLSQAQKKVFDAVESCRTARLGGHRIHCKACGKNEISYNSCRNRHCPKCLGSKTAKWMQERAKELLPVPYFHCVFTIPHELNSLALGHKKQVFDILFKASSETLLEVAKTPKHLGANIGFFGILHTWTQALDFHPHVHFVIPSGGLSLDKKTWSKAKNKKFLLPLKVLSKVFRGKFIHYLKLAHDKGTINFDKFDDLIKSLYKNNWIVYCKPPFGSPQIVLKYLSRYTHKIAISNHRLVSLNNGAVSFFARNNKNLSNRRLINLNASEFLRRFLLHILPFHYTKIRHFGFLANHNRQLNLKLILSFFSAVINYCKTKLDKPFNLACSFCGSFSILFSSLLKINSS